MRFCLSLVICSSLVFAAEPSSLNVSVISGHPVVDGVYLNGHGPFRFLIDTGAQTNQIALTLARDIGLRASFRTEIVTLTGSVLAPGGRVADLKLAPLAAQDQEFIFTNLERVRQLSPNIQGVLGQEFLSHFDYLLDFAAHRIVFDAPQPENGNRISFHLIDGRPAVVTDKGNLVIDSGTAIAILYENPNRSQSRSLKFRIAGNSYNTLTTSVPRSKVLTEDGVLPANLFQSIYFSNSGKFLILNSYRREPACIGGQKSLRSHIIKIPLTEILSTS